MAEASVQEGLTIDNPFSLAFPNTRTGSFCGRNTEVAELKELLANGQNVALISPRRLGKTCLIRHLFDDEEIRHKYRCFYVDVYPTNSISEFAELLERSILTELLSKGQQAMKRILDFLTSSRPYFSVDPVAGKVVLSFNHEDKRPPLAILNSLFKYIEQADKTCIIAIDEFQQLSQYGDKHTEETLRAYIESCTNARFIFIGSQQEMLDRMFVLPPRPFYYSVSLYLLQPLSCLTYKAFCISKFKAAGKHLEGDVVERIYDVLNAVTFEMQRVLNLLYSQTEKGSTCDRSMADRAIAEVANQHAVIYESILDRMTELQRRLLFAIAREGKVERIFPPEFRRRYNLNSIPETRFSMMRLLDNKLVTIYGDLYSISDPIFSMWLTSQYATS